MRTLHVIAILLAAPLCACATGPGGTYATPRQPAATAVAAVETPFHMAFKLATCIARTPLLLPGTVASAIVPFSGSNQPSGGAYFVANARADCGGSYVVTPSQVATEP